jgi:hypothetical protein
MQTCLASHVDKVRALDSVDVIKREVGLLRQLVEKTINNDALDREEEEFGKEDDDDARSIRTGAEGGA